MPATPQPRIVAPLSRARKVQGPPLSRGQATRDAWARSLAFLERHIGHRSG